MTPCPSRQSEYDSFLRTGIAGIEYLRHHETCDRCQQAMLSDPRFDGLLRTIGVELGRYPMEANAMGDE